MLDIAAQYPDLDEHLKLILATRGLRGYQSLVSEDVAQSRQSFLEITKVTTLKKQPVASTRDFEITVNGTQTLKVRHYQPLNASNAQQPLPLIMYYHGGAFVVGDLDTADEPCRMICHFANAHVLSVDYRLSPEHPAPAAIEDCEAALRWAHENAAQLGIDAKRIAVAGDSAGGNLAAMVSQRAKAATYRPLAQLLIYPVTDFVGQYASHTLFSEGLFLSQEDLDHAALFYFGAQDMRQRAELYSPIYGDLSSLPPALLVTATYDVLRDEGEAYAYKMQHAGSYCELQRAPRVGHGFANLTAINKTCYSLTAQMAQDFRMLMDKVSKSDTPA